MDDLISRKAVFELLDDIDSIYLEDYDDTFKSYTDLVNALFDEDRLPSAQPEIIRCKDCIKREICRTSTTWAVAPKDDWYCADAERRTDGSD